MSTKTDIKKPHRCTSVECCEPEECEQPALERRVQPCLRGNDWCPVGCCSYLFEREAEQS